MILRFKYNNFGVGQFLPDPQVSRINSFEPEREFVIKVDVYSPGILFLRLNRGYRAAHSIFAYRASARRFITYKRNLSDKQARRAMPMAVKLLH